MAAIVVDSGRGDSCRAIKNIRKLLEALGAEAKALRM
jgi:hypothetical protein